MPLTSLTARLGLDTNEFQAGIANARNQARTFTTNAAANFAAAAGVTGMGAMVASSISLGQELTNMAAIAGLSVEEFQELAHGASTVGIEADKLSDIYKDMNDRVGDFLETGGGPMADFFENIAPQVGVTAEQFRDLNSADALQLFVSSLEQANLSQADMTFYMEAMASDSTALLPLLMDNGAAMAEYADEAREAGLVMSNETAQGLADAAVELDQFKTRLQVGTAELTSTAIPAFNTLGNTLTLVGDTLGALGASFVAMLELLASNAQTWLTPVGNAFTALGQNIEGVWHAVNRNWDEAGNSFAAADQAMTDMATNTASIPDQMTANWDQFHNTLDAGAEQLATSWSTFYDDTREDLGLLTAEEEAANAASLAAAEERAALNEETRAAERKAHLESVEEEEAFYALVDELNDEVEEQEKQAQRLSRQNHATRQAAARASRADALSAAREYRTETLAAMAQRESIENRMGIVLTGGREDIRRMIELEQRVGETPRARRERERQARRDETTRRREMTELVRLQREQREQWNSMSAEERAKATEFQGRQRTAADNLAAAGDDLLLAGLGFEDTANNNKAAADQLAASGATLETSVSGFGSATEELDTAATSVESAAADLLAATSAEVAPEWQWLAQRQDEIIEHLQSIDEEVNRNP
jgi:acetolactate synthase small subunit